MFDQQPKQPAPSSGAVWSERHREVFREKRDLDERILKLSAEANASTDPAVRALIHSEVAAAQHRSNILKERLAAFVST